MIVLLHTLPKYIYITEVAESVTAVLQACLPIVAIEKDSESIDLSKSCDHH